MTRALKVVFLVHAVVALIFGLPLLIVPGRLLTLLRWAPIDPIISRLLGAALLGLGWMCFRGWQGGQRGVRAFVEADLVFTALACVGLARHLFVGHWPLVPWLLFGLFLVFSLAWALLLVKAKN